MRQSGSFVRFPVPRGEQRALLLLEDLERPPAGRPVDAQPRHLQAPAPGGGAQLGEVPELGALEEALAHVRDAALDARLVAGPAHACGVGDEAALAGVLQEAPREARVQRVGPGHGGREVVDDEVAGHALEERPGRLQTLDYRVQPLARGRPDEAVPRVAPDHDQRPDRAAPPALGVRDEAETAEVQLRDLARRPVLHAHGHRLPATPAAAGDEAPQRAVGDLAAALGQQLLDPRDLQALGRQPALDLLRPGRQQLLTRDRHLPRPRRTQRRQAGELLLTRLGTAGLEPGRLGRLDVAPHRLSRQSRASGDPALAESRLPASNDLPDLHGQDLPVGHRCSLPWGCRRCWPYRRPGWSIDPGEVAHSSWRSRHLLVHSSWRFTLRSRMTYTSRPNTTSALISGMSPVPNVGRTRPTADMSLCRPVATTRP